MPGKIKCVAGTSGQILIDIGKPCASARQIDSVLCDLRRDLRRDPLQEGFHFRNLTKQQERTGMKAYGNQGIQRVQGR